MNGQKKAYVVAGASLLFVVACLGVTSVVYRQKDMPERTGKLVFEDDFEREEVGELYFQGEPDPGNPAGQWRIDQGHLRAEKIHNAALWLQKELPPQVRVELDVRALSNEGDAKCEIFGDGRTHQSGYILINGGWNNSVNCIARQDEHGEDRKNDKRCPNKGNRRLCIEPDIDYHWTIERTDNVLRWYVDQKLFLVFDDSNPIEGRYFGFNNWEAPVLFDNLRIYDLAN